MSQSAPVAPEPSPPAGEPAAPEGEGFFDTLLALYTAPREGFTAVLKRGGWVVPLLVIVACNLLFTALWMQKVDPVQFMRNEMEASGRMSEIPPERMEAIVEQQARFFPVFGWLGGLLGAPLVVVALAGLFLFVYRFFYGGEVGFGQSLAVVAWSFLAVGLVSLPLTVAVYALKGDWNLNPQNVLQANLSLLMDKEGASPGLYALAQSLDLFSLWLVFLLSAGFGVAIRRSTGSAAWGVVWPWLVWVLGRAGLAALMA